MTPSSPAPSLLQLDYYDESEFATLVKNYAKTRR